MSLKLPVLSSSSLSSFAQSLAAMPSLTAEEEFQLAKKYQEEGCLKSAHVLALSYFRFVMAIAKRYSGYGLPQEDLVHEGAVGLMKAVKSFDPEKGFRFSTFAVCWIKAQINEFVLRNWSIVKIATTKAQRKLFFNLRKMKGLKDVLEKKDISIIASSLDVPEFEVRSMDLRLSGRDISFDPTPDFHEEHDFSPILYLADPADNPEQNLIRSTEVNRQEESLALALESLDERSRDIIKARWLSDDNKQTLTELGKKYGISYERVRQLEAQALKRIKNVLA